MLGVCLGPAVLRPPLHLPLILPTLPSLRLSLSGSDLGRPSPPTTFSGLPAWAGPFQNHRALLRPSAPSSSASCSICSCPKLPFLAPVHSRFVPPVWTTSSLDPASPGWKTGPESRPVPDPTQTPEPPPSPQEHHAALPAPRRARAAVSSKVGPISPSLRLLVESVLVSAWRASWGHLQPSVAHPSACPCLQCVLNSS